MPRLMPQHVRCHKPCAHKRHRTVARRGGSDIRSGIMRSRSVLPTALRRLGQCHGPHQIMSKRVPQRYRLYLLQPSHHKLLKPTPTRNSVDTFSGGGALLVDLLGLATAHTLTPTGNNRAVIGEWLIRISTGIFGFGYWGIDRGPLGISIFDGIVAGVAAIDEPLGGPLPVALFDVIEHRGEPSEITANVADIDADDNLGIGGGGELDIVGRTKTPVGHLHHPRLPIGAGSPGLGALGVLFLSLVVFLRCRLFLFLLLDLSEFGQRLGHTLLALLSRALTGRSATAVTGVRVGLDLVLKRLDLRLGFFHTTLQGGATAKGGRPGARSYPHPVLRHSLQFHPSLLHQHRHAVGEQLIENLNARTAKIRQRMMVHVHPAADPTVSIVRLRQSLDPPRAAQSDYAAPRARAPHAHCLAQLAGLPQSRGNRKTVKVDCSWYYVSHTTKP